MSNKPRIVLDSNVVVSALLFHQGKPALAFNTALNIAEIIASEEIIKEWNDVLNRKKFEKYLTKKDRNLFFQSLLKEITLIDIHINIQVCRDPKDDKYLEAAFNGKADFIVSGDADLLVLQPFRGIDILNPNDFLNRMNV